MVRRVLARPGFQADGQPPPAVREALKAKALQEVLSKASFEVAAGDSPKEFGEQFQADLKRWGEVVKVSGFTPED